MIRIKSFFYYNEIKEIMNTRKIAIPYKKNILPYIRSTSREGKKTTTDRRLIKSNNILLSPRNRYKIQNIQKLSPNQNNKQINDGDATKTESATESTYDTAKKIALNKKKISGIVNNFDSNSNKSRKIPLCSLKGRNEVFSFIRCTSEDNLKRKRNINYNFEKSLSYKKDNENSIRKKNYYSPKNNDINNIYGVNKHIRKICKKNELINIEDLMLLESIFNNVISSIKNKSTIKNECFEFINFYNYSSLYNKFENFFISQDSKLIARSAVNLMIFDVILVYHSSFNKLVFKRNSFYIREIIDMNHKCYLLLCEYILSKVPLKELGNIWVNRLRNMLEKKLNHVNIKNDMKYYCYRSAKNLLKPTITEDNITEIKYYLNNIKNCLKGILNSLKENKYEFIDDFINMNNNITFLSSGELIKFFRKKIIRIISKNGSVYGDGVELYETIKETISDIKIPFLNSKLRKKFTLILDLDETLISFKFIEDSDNRGKMSLRPGLHDFLNNMKKYYELVLFTSATKDYADPLVDLIESKEKIFDYRLYRNHTIIYEDILVKDISKLGRSIEKMIIVDNLPQNFRLQKENGIMIKAFWGDDIYDNALTELKKILILIANKFDDVREGIAYYKDDILSKVSSNFN